MNILYSGQILDLKKKIDTNDESFHNEDSLWINSTEQRYLPNMKFVGGFPNEWCITLKDISDEYSIETYKDRIIALIIKENDTYMVYMEEPISFEIGGNNLQEAQENFWHWLRQEDRYGSLVFKKYRSVVNIKCPNCGHEWWFDENSLPIGETYECICVECKTSLKRKRGISYESTRCINCSEKL